MLRIYLSTEIGDDKNDGLSDKSPVRSARRVIALCKGDNEIVITERVEFEPAPEPRLARQRSRCPLERGGRTKCRCDRLR